MLLPLICPMCREPLLDQRPLQKSWQCINRHNFDIAREGYLNLHLVQHKKSRDPGDLPEMVQARRDFLGAGYYKPLRDAVVSLLASLQARVLLDIGCGEGYYTSRFAAVVPQVIGLDIAKSAVQMAAKSDKALTWVVGSGALVPLADGSVDVATSLFSPQPIIEMQRVLTARGYVLVVTPAPQHLWTVRQGLFDEVQAHVPDKFLTGFAEGFELIKRQEVSVPLHLSNAALKDLLMMTPYVWKAKADKRAALEQAETFETEAAFTLFLFQKKALLEEGISSEEGA